MSMTRKEFEKMVAKEWPHAVPEKYRALIKNVVFLVEDEPSGEVRAREGLEDDETLLGYYQGIPHTARGDMYGVGATMPDTITLYQVPIEEEAREMAKTSRKRDVRPWATDKERASPTHPTSDAFREALRQVVRETIWHEVAHHFGFDEDAVRLKEDERKKSNSA